jgi:hypothetical protein
VQYMLLIYESEAAWEGLTEAERSASVARHIDFARQLREEGRLLYGDGLQPTGTATTVRHKEGRVVLTDGPFAETKEQLGGFYVIEAENLDQALADASTISDRESEVVEVRPIMDYS